MAVSTDTTLSEPQIRAARKLLHWSPDLLARRAHLAVGVVLQAERDGGMGLLPLAAARAIQQVLREAGVEPVEDGQVRLRG